MSAPGPHPFDPRIVDNSNNLLIESKCVLCGFRIVGSALESLQEDEDGHAATCPKKHSSGTSDSATAH